MHGRHRGDVSNALSEDAVPCAGGALGLLDYKAFLSLFCSLTCSSLGRLGMMLQVTFLFRGARGMSGFRLDVV